jgi:hypothetical protein
VYLRLPHRDQPHGVLALLSLCCAVGVLRQPLYALILIPALPCLLGAAELRANN